MPFNRFMLPALPFLLLIFATGCHVIHQKTGHRPWLSRTVVPAMTVWVLIQPLLPQSDAVTQGFIAVRYRLLGISHPKGIIDDAVIRNTSTDESWIDRKQAAGEWLRDNTPPGATLALGNAGIIPYYSGLKTIDFFGLVTPGIARSNRSSGWALAGHQKYSQAYVMTKEPDYIMFSGQANPFCEPIWWLQQFKFHKCPAFRKNYRYCVVETGDYQFGFYERQPKAMARHY